MPRTDRPTYRPSGRVNLPAFLPLLAVASAAALGMGYVLAKAFHNGFFVVVISPLVGGLVTAAPVWVACRAGACRSRAVGGLAGLAAGLVYFLGYYQFDMAHQLGDRFLTRVDLLPRYVELRVKTDVSRRAGDPKNAVQAPRPDDTVDLVFRWVKFGLNALAAVLPALAAGVAQSGKPFSERHKRWLTSHLARLPAGAADEVLEGLDTGNPGVLDAALTPGPTDPAEYTQLLIEYVPGEADSPVYLSVAAVTNGDKPGKMTVRSQLSQALLSSWEAAVLATRVAVPQAGFGPPPEPAVLPTAPPGLAARIEPLPGEQAGQVLTAGAKAWATVVGLSPLALGLGAAGGLVYAGFEFQDEIGTPGLVGACLAGLGVMVVTLVYLTWYGDYLPSRVFYARSRSAIADRPDAVVDPDDPDAVYVQVVPRANWGVIMVENATDVGFLKVDDRRRVILFEGDRERWVIPGEAVRSLQIEEFRTPAGGDESAAFPMVVLTADAGGRVWEAPVAHRHVWFGKRGVKERRRLAVELREALAVAAPQARDEGE